ncbi:MAG: group I truncated hemoglobin [Deltaproteobacteria bacterium]|jgi:hemoglobin
MKRTLLLAPALAVLSLVGCDSPSPSPDAATTRPDSAVPPTDGGSTLYTRLGGRSGIAAAVDAIVADEVADAEIAAFFAGAGTGGRPTVDQIKACLVNQVGNAAGGPEAYPGVPADSMGHQCRSMADAHEGLGISGEVFDRFVTIAAGTLMRLGVASEDIATIGSVLVGTRGDIVEESTLYMRLGGHEGIAMAVDAIVMDEVADAEIAAFFAGAGTGGRPTVAQIKACLVNQLGNAAGGPEAYPGVPADSMGHQCRSMAEAHAGLGISGTVFDRFVTIAAGTLMRLGVAGEDIAILGGVLNGTRGDIVE